jgi:hypothetical protein
VTPFDDYRPVVTVPIEATVEATVTVTELGACTAEIITITELASMAEIVTIPADANTNAEILSAGYGGCRNGNSRERCKRNTKRSHIPSSHRCPRENGGNES